MSFKYLTILLVAITMIALNTVSTTGVLIACDNLYLNKEEKSRLAIFTLGLPHVALHKDESVVAFDCRVRGLVLRVNTPEDWTVSVDENGEGGRAHVKANILDGAAAIDADNFGYFTNFMVIAKIKSEPGLTGGFFDVSVVLTIAKQAEGTSRSLTFSKAQIHLTKID